MGSECCMADVKPEPVELERLHRSQLSPERKRKSEWKGRSSIIRKRQWIDEDVRQRHLPSNYDFIPKMPDLSQGANLAFVKLGSFDMAKANVTESMTAAFKLIPEGGPFKLEDGVYEGLWKNKKRHGQGTFYTNDGGIYEGLWENDLRHGFGRHIYANGDVYEGTWLDDEMSGDGTMVWIDGSQYDGQWANNGMSGYGTYRWKDGRTYTGEWQASQHHGQGTIVTPQADENGYALPPSKYVGQFQFGLKDGFGVLTWGDGVRKYDGQWKDGKFHGRGLYINQEGKAMEGMWNQGGFSKGQKGYSDFQPEHQNKLRRTISIPIQMKGQREGPAFG